MMGRKLDLSGLTDNEAEHVLQVVQRDMKLRKKEEERLSELKQELDEEGSRCRLLSRQSCFNRRCCIRCCSPFTFLLNPRRECRDCHYNVCKACRVYNKRDKAWLCSACQKSRLLKTQSLEWFYTNVKQRFRRFGSAKVLKTLYRKHLAEHCALSELTEGSACEESICNEGSVCGSDSTFYRQTEEHSMAETLTVAMRVAEEAIDEAISKAEFDTSSQEKQNEAQYLREHREELIEELANTIVQKIISRRKTLAETRAEYDPAWTLERNTDLHHHHQSACDRASSSLKHQTSLWRSHSAFSLLDNDPPGMIQDSPQTLKKEGGGPAMTAWKSVDRLDNAVLKSPDGNWIALQSAQLSRPSLLTKRKSLVYSALERESGVVSAYEGLGSDNETKPEPDSSWGAVLQEIHRKMTDSNFNLDNAGDRIPSPSVGRPGSRDLLSDSEESRKPSKPLLALLKRKVPAEIRIKPSSRRTSVIDVNFNLEGAGAEQEEQEEQQEEQEEFKVAAKPEVAKVRKSRKKRRRNEAAASSSVSDLNRKDHNLQSSDAVTTDTLTSGATTPELSDPKGDITGNGANQTDEELALKLQQRAGRVSDSSAREEELNEDGDAGDDGQSEGGSQGSKDRDDERSWRMEVDLDGGRTEDDEEEMKYRLYRLVAQSRLTYLSSTDDELDRAGLSEGEWDGDKDEDMEEEDQEQGEETMDGLPYRLCQLEEEVRATQFSSTEDELDRIGVEETKNGEEEEDNEELAVKVCRLAHQANAIQFSSTEDELDRAGRGDEGQEAIDEETLWTLQAETAVQAAQLRDLASLVSASQFSSTEDELGRFVDNEAETEQEVNEGGTESSIEMEELWEGAAGRRESIGDVDEKMFDLRDETVTSETNVEDDEHVDGEVEDETTAERHLCDEEVEVLKGDEADGQPEERREEVDAGRSEEVIVLHETKVQLENQPDAKTRDEEDEFQNERRDSRGRWEPAADSDEEEFDRIISSMLMMTLEDMQVDTVKDDAEGGGGRSREAEDEGADVKTAGEDAFREQVVDASEETGSVPEELGSRGGDERPESVTRERPGLTEGEASGKQEAGGGRGNVQEEAGKAPMKETPETNEAEEDDEEEQDGGGNMAEWQEVETRGDAAVVDERLEETEQSSTSRLREGFLSPEEIQNRYSAVSLRSITTEVLKVLNATEELLQGVEGGDDARLSTPSLPPNTDPKKLDQQFCRLEENVYVAAGSVYGLEAELSDLEECARGICSSTSDMELSFLEEQVAAAAAKVQQSELQISDISARIAALRSAGLNVDTQSRLTKNRTVPVMPVTLDSSRQLRRRLPAPPVKAEKEA